MILPTKSVSVIGIGILFSLVDSAQITCDDTTPAVGSTLKCECTDLSGYGVDWWKGNSIISTCSSNPKIGCDSPPTGYEFQVNSTSKYFMEINSYTYLNCDRYKCSDLLGSSTSSALDISISNTTLDLTQKVELTETNTTGNITILTGCLFISTENVQKRIQTKWYKILNDSIKAFPGNSTAVFEDTCHECNGVRARQLKVILFYTESEESLNNEKERVQLMLQIYDENDPSNSQNINTSNKYIISVATNRGEEDEECPCCIITLAVVSTLMGILLLSDVSLFIDNCKGVNQENVMRRPYFSPFALPSIIYSVYHQCKKTDMTDIWFIITTLLTDIIVTSVVFVYCTSEGKFECNLRHCYLKMKIPTQDI
ncbi:uncharacterized protein LOC128554653 isoform X1 [Mercenaria mercenaria]|uniref:uncharacterized protein LOC128554653 isoform X1 n=1 Tax=Mercenaria mercenaria TaxID=6596 RepID=UPI00234EBF7D|nr:uncharacterized protein LOC128554653 isoform X1 [Mercenaria mercenaria]XP_053391923.1 uncharacterized protein LOC128554653 isoform X1 [Mercenaria mercenaria]